MALVYVHHLRIAIISFFIRSSSNSPPIKKKRPTRTSMVLLYAYDWGLTLGKDLFLFGASKIRLANSVAPFEIVYIQGIE